MTMNRLSAHGSRARIGVVQFPGSNCDIDCQDAFSRLFSIELLNLWHTQTALPSLDGVLIPGGFSYGDYLRSGALASCSPIMPAIKGFVARGGAVLGICNGFQILTESGLLPGTLLRNAGQNFVCKQTTLKVNRGSSVYHQKLAGVLVRLPIAHGEGRYYADEADLKSLVDNEQILFQYVNNEGELTSEANPNGALDNIAGITSKNGRVVGMMPHPERASDTLLGSFDGKLVLEAFLETALS